MSNNFETKSGKEAASILSSNMEVGLTTDEANSRIAKYGENKLKEKKKKSIIRIFFEQMNNPMIFVLFAAIAVTIGVSIYNVVSPKGSGEGEWADICIIVAVIIINSIIGTIQEVKADASLEALKKMSSPMVNVLRDGKINKIKSSELTIGDIVLLEDGDIVGADMRLIESHNLKVNESALTGESVPVEKNADIVFTKELPIGDRINMLYSSTIVTYGRAKAIVTNIGMNTEIGNIAKSLTDEEGELTPLQKVLEKLSKFLGLLTLGIVVVVFLVDMIWLIVDGHAGNITEWVNAILAAIALAVAAIPEGLVAVVTIVLAIGVTRMVKANTIVRKLPSVETLGSVNVVCSDKTGTLTQNKMTVVSYYVNNKKYEEFKNSKEIDFLATGFALCSNATLTYGDPTEIALIAFADKLNLKKEDLEKKYPRTNELPFDSDRKMMSTKNGEFIFTKGSLDSIISNTKYILENDKAREINKQDIDKIYKVNSEYSNNALRVLALAYKKADSIKESDLIFVGLVAMIDPPRAEAKDAVNKLKTAGIKTVMITGDYKDTAFAIARQLNIANNINECMSGTDIDKLSKEQLQEAVKTHCVYARVSPQNKVDIVKAIKANDCIVAMTGDGVNDAPSLKSADIGIAMGITGTDVAKDAADMVLTDDNFASIEKAVEEGRGIFANIKKTVIFLLSSNFAEVMTMFVIICLGFPTPFIAIHLLWINLLTDSTPAIALGMDPKDPNVMKEKPRNKKDSFFSNGGLRRTVLYGILITIAVVIAYFIPAWDNGVTGYMNIKNLYNNNSVILHQAQTFAFTTLAFCELFHMLGMSNPDKSFIYAFKNKNKMMYFALFAGIGLQLFVVLTPGVSDIFKTHNLKGLEWLYCALLSLLPLIVHEIVVLVKYIKKMSKK